MLTISITSTPVSGSKSYTVSDADVQSLLNWAAVAFANLIQSTFNPTGIPGFVPTSQQILLAWVQNWISMTKASVQIFNTPAPVSPPQISIT
jgi:hypothetical protein